MKTLLKLIDLAGHMLLIAFTFLFAFGAICSMACLFIEGDIFAIIGVAACSFLSWTCWNVREDL